MAEDLSQIPKVSTGIPQVTGSIPQIDVPFTQNATGSDASENPYHLHQSDNPSSVVIDPPLSGLNYITWSPAFALAISVKNKTGFIDSSIPTPDLTGSLYRPWLRCNKLLLTWLLNSVSKEIAASVLYINSAREVWETLKISGLDLYSYKSRSKSLRLC